MVELEHRQQLAEPARRDARPMQRADVAVLHAVKDAREAVESALSSSDRRITGMIESKRMV